MTLLALYLIYALALSIALARKGVRASTGGNFCLQKKGNCDY